MNRYWLNVIRKLHLNSGRVCQSLVNSTIRLWRVEACLSALCDIRQFVRCICFSWRFLIIVSKILAVLVSPSTAALYLATLSNHLALSSVALLWYSRSLFHAPWASLWASTSNMHPIASFTTFAFVTNSCAFVVVGM